MNDQMHNEIGRSTNNLDKMLWTGSVICIGLLLGLGGWTCAKASETRTPIKHLIVVIGENRSFDNVFATYVPSNPRQSVWNLLSQGIVDKTGAPGLNAAKALQRQATDPATYQSPPSITGAFSTLPQPSTTLNGLPVSPCSLSQVLSAFGKNPSNIS